MPRQREDLEGRRVVVTGATGFIGRRLVPALQAAGAEVTVVLRSSHGARRFKGMGARAVVGRLDDPAAMQQTLKGCDSLLHLAYDMRASARDNLAVFGRLVDAAEAAAVGRFVHLSSIVVYDGWPTQDLTEESPLGGPGGSPYRQAKIEMERRLMAGPLPCAILQPTLVYGPGSALWTDNLAEMLGAGIVLPDPEGRANLVFVGDVVQAVIRAAVFDNPGHERFIVSGPETVAWSELFDGYAAIIGKGSYRHLPHDELAARLGPVDEIADEPSTAAKVSAVARQALGRERFEALVRAVKGRLRKPAGEVWPDQHLLELLAATGQCSIAHARERLGYAPAYTLKDGLAATAWYLKERHGRR